MVGYRYLILLCGLLLYSCAQVGNITGGPKDEAAPVPLAKKTSPPNGSTNFTTKTVEFTFDEFFRLNEPNLNIRMVPPHATIESRVKGKKLILTWEEDLHANTTYAIYLNNAVRDITESNDSIIQYAFSTGDVLDTLSYEVRVVDAWSNAAATNCVVALYEAETNELMSFAETNKSGIARMQFLHPRRYKMLAFRDSNGDLEAQDHEQVGFIYDAPFQLDSSRVDSIPVRLFSQKPTPGITKAAYQSPSSVFVGSTTPFKDAKTWANGKLISEKDYTALAEDSLRIFTDLTDTSQLELVIATADYQDTTNLRFFNRTVPAPTFAPVKSNYTFSPWEEVQFSSNARFTDLDTSGLAIMHKTDSTFFRPTAVRIDNNILTLELDSLMEDGKYEFTFADSSIVTELGKLRKKSFGITLSPKRKYGTLILDLHDYKEYGILLSLMKGGREERRLVLEPNQGSISIEGLSPGDYSFVVVRDLNLNGQWDVGDLETFQQPEPVDHYSTPIKVRANWDVETALIPTQE